MRVKSVATLTTLAAILAISSCSISTQEDSPAPKPRHSGRLPEPTGLALGIDLPFDRYEMQLGEYNKISNAQDVLTRDCMRGKHLSWPLITRPTTVPDLRNRRRYGVIEPQVAQQYGYHNGQKLTNPHSTDAQEDARERSLTEKQREGALTHGAGCAFKAIAEVRDAPRESVDLDTFNSLGSIAMKDSMKDPAVVRAFSEWSACMRRVDAHYGDPYQAVNDRTWWKNGESGPASAREIVVARRDVECKERADLVHIWAGSEKRKQEALIARNRAYFAKVARAKSEQLSFASRVLKRSDATHPSHPNTGY